MVDDALHLAMVLAGVAAFLVVPLPVAIPIFAAMSGLVLHVASDDASKASLRGRL